MPRNDFINVDGTINYDNIESVQDFNSYVSDNATDIKRWGAKGDGITDDTVAIQAAINSLPYGGIVYIPIGNFMIGSPIIINTPIQLIGAGYFSRIIPKSTYSNSQDLIYIKPNMNIGGTGIQLINLYIGTDVYASPRGLHAVGIDTTQAVGDNVAKFLMSGCFIAPVTGYGLYVTNDGVKNTNGGFYTSTIEGNTINCGIFMDAVGDSIVIRENVLTNKNCGVDVSLISGASLLTIEDNNITNTGGAIRIRAGRRVKILRNNCEQQVATTSPNLAMIDLDGSNGTLILCKVEDNHTGAFTGSGITKNIRVNNSIGAIVKDNTILPSGGDGINISASCSSAQIGFNTFGSAIANRVTDAGTGTTGVLKDITLLNGWVNYNASYYTTARYYKDIEGVVHLEGRISGGTTTSGTVLFNLPAGVRSKLITSLHAGTFSSSIQSGEIAVNPDGTVTVLSAQSAYLDLNGLSFITDQNNYVSSDL